MKQSAFEKEYLKAQKQTDRILHVIDALEIMLGNGEVDNAVLGADMLNEEVVKLLEITRQLPMFTGRPEATFDTDKVMADAMDIQIGYTEHGWFSVYMPALLPGKEKGMADYIRNGLVAGLNVYFCENEFFLLDDCVIATCNIYDAMLTGRKWRDYDNREHKAAIDVLASFVLQDDSPLFHHQYNCSLYGHKDGTAIYFIPHDEMDRWLLYMAMKELPAIYFD